MSTQMAQAKTLRLCGSRYYKVTVGVAGTYV